MASVEHLGRVAATVLSCRNTMRPPHGRVRFGSAHFTRTVRAPGVAAGRARRVTTPRPQLAVRQCRFVAYRVGAASNLADRRDMRSVSYRRLSAAWVMFLRQVHASGPQLSGSLDFGGRMDTPRQANVRMMNIRRRNQKGDSGPPQSTPGSSYAASAPGAKAAAQSGSDPADHNSTPPVGRLPASG